MRPLALPFAAMLLLFAVGCDRSPSPTDERTPREVLLLAAASTTDAVSEVARAFEAEAGVAVKVTTGGSNALATQVLFGAPGHVFLSANPRWAEEVEAKGHALEVHELLSNRLVLVVPEGNPASVRAPRDLLSEGVSHVALAGENVPAGAYAEEALRFEQCYETLVARNRIARGQDVRSTLGYVEAGEAQAGVVYATDARVSGKVEVVYTFEPRAHDRILYPIVLLDVARQHGAARRFFDFLRGPRAMAVFEQHGFLPARERP